MARELRVLCLTNTVKKISASNWPTTLGADGAFNDTSATYVANNYSMAITLNRDILIIDGNKDISINFLSSSSLTYKQGFKVPVGFMNITVTAFTGTVKILRYNYQTMGTTINEAYLSTNAVLAVEKDILYPGDIIVANNAAMTSFELEFQLDPCLRYSKTGFDVANLINKD